MGEANLNSRTGGSRLEARYVTLGPAGEGRDKAVQALGWKAPHLGLVAASSPRPFERLIKWSLQHSPKIDIVDKTIYSLFGDEGRTLVKKHG